MIPVMLAMVAAEIPNPNVLTNSRRVCFWVGMAKLLFLIQMPSNKMFFVFRMAKNACHSFG
jgi:hypothetical protein